jgi:hypothetical protein
MEKAGLLASRFASISEELDLSNGLTLAGFRSAIATVAFNLNDYNKKLSESDTALNLLADAERALAEHSERMLLGVATRFGKDSNEYEKAGGVRKSVFRSRVRKAKAMIAQEKNA